MSAPERRERLHELREAVSRRLGSSVRAVREIAGGSINRAYAMALADGRQIFVKSRDDAPDGHFAAEAWGLEWLAASGALRVPRVRALSDDAPTRYLALEWIEPGAPSRDFDAALGRGLARLHAAGAPRFGLAHDNWIAWLPQSNAESADWPSFYRDRRLEPLVRDARDAGRLPSDVGRAFARVLDRIDQLTGPPEPPARLHGDLWTGNVHCDATGAPCLVDPAVYAGHREVDLAMLRLFGAPARACFDAYEEISPLAAGAAERVALHQLYPLLVHVRLFGAGYVPRLRAALECYA